MKDTKQTLILAILLSLCVCLGLVMRTLWKVNRTVTEIQTLFVEQGKMLAKDAGTYLRDEYSDDLKKLSQAQLDSLETVLNNFWK